MIIADCAPHLCDHHPRREHMNTLEQAVSVSFKNILPATDLSPASERALECARTLAREHSAVHTLHVSGSDNYQRARHVRF